MNKRYVYFVGISVVVGGEVHTLCREITVDRPVTSIGDVEGWLTTGIIDYLATTNPGWDVRSSTWRSRIVIVGCSLFRTETQQPNGEWVAA